MKTFYATLFAIVLSFSTYAKSGKVQLSGRVANASLATLSISYVNNFELTTLEINEDGSFESTFTIEQGYYFFEYGRNSAYLYLSPKDALSVFFDAKDFENTLRFEGRGAERNNYLVLKSKIDKEVTGNLEAFYKVGESAYLENLSALQDKQLEALETFAVEPFFRKAETKSLEYERLLNIQNYASNYEFYLGEEITPSQQFFTPLDNLNLNDQEDYMTHPYYHYLVNAIWNKRIEAEPDVDGMLEVLKKVPSRDLALSLINGFYSKISNKEGRAKDYLDLIKRVVTHQPFIEASEKRYEEVMASEGLQTGDPSPNFRFEDAEGNTVALSDLRGSYVYIDVWATWCAPCIKQVPYLKELETRYHQKNIIFVSISVDKEALKGTWKKMISDKELGGLQLFADNSFDSDFMNAYAVNSIPRFILIDPDGNIVDAEAPRPSFEKTRKRLDALLK
ncbi:TlpA family protein disulfide reductase [Altibacter sp. HG106]|uniref:TlpA family protein disulfide reductase n=1 Tax=Altibacter sp. HG106 TaxID=3023937 RepID=UPI002350DFCB|nr:TlpA disulfide reductase family protein [Altibacter sp. HG106]MDC7995641.1 TlpA disulfide reductase family protein [Altibacter sp. HG106]